MIGLRERLSQVMGGRDRRILAGSVGTVRVYQPHVQRTTPWAMATSAHRLAVQQRRSLSRGAQFCVAGDFGRAGYWTTSVLYQQKNIVPRSPVGHAWGAGCPVFDLLSKAMLEALAAAGGRPDALGPAPPTFSTFERGGPPKGEGPHATVIRTPGFIGTPYMAAQLFCGLYQHLHAGQNRAPWAPPCRVALRALYFSTHYLKQY